MHKIKTKPMLMIKKMAKLKSVKRNFALFWAAIKSDFQFLLKKIIARLYKDE